MRVGKRGVPTRRYAGCGRQRSLKRRKSIRFSKAQLATCKILGIRCVLVQPDGWAQGEREGYGEPCDVTSLSLSLSAICNVQ